MLPKFHGTDVEFQFINVLVTKSFIFSAYTIFAVCNLLLMH